MGGSILQKRPLGDTGIAVSLIGLGTVKFGRNQGVKYPAAFTLPSDKEIERLLGVATDVGINLLDTAPAYGLSEERLGKLLQGQRHQWVISTKAGEEFVEGVSQFDFSRQAIQASVERSLRRLKTDYLDVVLVHSDGRDTALIDEENVFETLQMLKQQGKLRAYGMSSKTIDGGKKTIEHADVAMVTYNASYTDEREVIHYAEQCHKAVFIKKGLGSGHLPAAEALQFILAERGVTSVIVGTINPAHLRENVSEVAK